MGFWFSIPHKFYILSWGIHKNTNTNIHKGIKEIGKMYAVEEIYLITTVHMYSTWNIKEPIHGRMVLIHFSIPKIQKIHINTRAGGLRFR